MLLLRNHTFPLSKLPVKHARTHTHHYFYVLRRCDKGIYDFAQPEHIRDFVTVLSKLFKLLS